jgi:periplasmic copper chaperone A
VGAGGPGLRGNLGGVQRFSRVIGVVGAVALVVGAATGCAPSRNHAGGAGIVSTGAYVQQPTSNGAATVGYLDIRNNGDADTLLSVTTSVGGKVELRGPIGNGQTPVVMHTISSIPLPADATTELDPTSYHLLISGAGAMHNGKDIELTLHFAHGTSITVYALVTNPQDSGGSSYFLED